MMAYEHTARSDLEMVEGGRDARRLLSRLQLIHLPHVRLLLNQISG